MGEAHRPPRRVGILGGLGPEATVLLMQKVIAAVPARDDGDHVPLIVDQNPQVPSRIRHLIEGSGEDPTPVLVEMARRLEGAGAEALAMPCNTAHHYASAIAESVSIPFIDMVALSVEQARTRVGAKGQVGILASPATRRIGLFDKVFRPAGLTAVYPEDEEAMPTAIRRPTAEGPGPEVRKTLASASAALVSRGANTQMVACTEFSLITSAVSPKAQAFDTLDLLVEALVAFSLGKRPATTPS